MLSVNMNRLFIYECVWQLRHVEDTKQLVVFSMNWNRLFHTGKNISYPNYYNYLQFNSSEKLPSLLSEPIYDHYMCTPIITCVRSTSSSTHVHSQLTCINIATAAFVFAEMRTHWSMCNDCRYIGVRSTRHKRQ